MEARPNEAVSLQTGPLILAYCPGEIWRAIPDTLGLGDWEVTPRPSWNFGLEIQEGTTELPLTVERQLPSTEPFALAPSPVRVTTRERFIPIWTLRHNSAAPGHPAR